jgi:hypothetical protein
MTTPIEMLTEPGRGKRFAKKSLIILAEAAIFAIGVEVGKDLYKLVRQRRAKKEPDVLPIDSVDDAPDAD